MPTYTKIAALTSLLVLLPSLGNTTISNPNGNTICVNNIPATTPDNQFSDNHDGTVTDNKTGLMWKRCSEGQTWGADLWSAGNTCNSIGTSYNWQTALQQAQTVNNTGGYAGKKDWRLPNVKELSSIVERQCSAPAINQIVFPSTDSYFLSGDFWTSTPNTKYDGDAWFVSFRSGDADEYVKSNSNQVRLVRGGQ